MLFGGSFFFFFFQAEDGIRDLTVTGVQTCALPISALTACWKRRSFRRPRILSTSSSTLAGAATGCDITVMAAPEKQRADIAVRPSIVPQPPRVAVHVNDQNFRPAFTPSTRGRSGTSALMS